MVAWGLGKVHDSFGVLLMHGICFNDHEMIPYFHSDPVMQAPRNIATLPASYVP